MNKNTTQGDGSIVSSSRPSPPYDARGNLLSASRSGASDSQVESYAYNLLGNMTSYTKNGATTSYTYDSSGLRTSKTHNGITTKYYLSGGIVLNEGLVTDSGVTLSATNYIGNEIFGRKNASDTVTSFLLSNGHGDIEAVMQGSTRVGTYQYDEYGNITAMNEADGLNNPIRYAGEYFDEESGNYYLRARYYNPSLGRFMAEDPAMDGQNWYAYCGGNPVMFVDPSGMVKEGDAERFGTNSLKYQLLVALGEAWELADEDDRAAIEATADQLRGFDDNSFNRVILLNDEDGAKERGHNAVLLLNSSGEGLVFSYYPTDENAGLALITGIDAEMRIGVLTSDEVNNLLYGDGWTGTLVATDGDLENEQYERFVYYGISGGQGYNIYYKATEISMNPGTYLLVGNQCDNVANQILKNGNVNYTVRFDPNKSYEEISGSKWSR